MPSRRATDHSRTELNNVAARRGQTLVYADSSIGPLDRPQWTSIVYLNGYEYGRGSSSTKGEAREGAAHQALALIARGY
ncbi:hypothetical protein DFH09DRAFT_1127657 [Mycena vulgaris]|nr:hypothetical protein DFH09DRAFT_1127657 [Mycena vulgaris]